MLSDKNPRRRHRLLIGILTLPIIFVVGFALILDYLPFSFRALVKDGMTVSMDAVEDYGLVRRLAYLVYEPSEVPRTGMEIGDGGHPLDAVFHDPTGIYVDSSGNIFVSERRHFRIRKIADNKIATLAGNGRRGFSGEGFSARLSRLQRPEGLDGNSSGDVFVADSFNHRIRRISKDGTITTIAGTGRPGFSGDGGPATKAQLHGPMDVKRGPSGALYILERDNHCVRRVSNDGTITTVAGTGEAGFSGDGGTAALGSLNEPYGIALDKHENIYIADSKNNRVRKVTPDGIITTIAGTAEAGFSGDGGPAVNAQLDSPQAVFVTAMGEVIINDEHNHRIRRIALNGTIETIAGTGEAGFSGDGGPATEAMLNDPEYLWVDSGGSLYITDGDNNRVRKVEPDGTISTIAGGGSIRYP